jgi:hypothetical protein
MEQGQHEMLETSASCLQNKKGNCDDSRLKVLQPQESTTRTMCDERTFAEQFLKPGKWTEPSYNSVPQNKL